MGAHPPPRDTQHSRSGAKPSVRSRGLCYVWCSATPPGSVSVPACVVRSRVHPGRDARVHPRSRQPSFTPRQRLTTANRAVRGWGSLEANGVAPLHHAPPQLTGSQLDAGSQLIALADSPGVSRGTRRATAGAGRRTPSVLAGHPRLCGSAIRSGIRQRTRAARDRRRVSIDLRTIRTGSTTFRCARPYDPRPQFRAQLASVRT